MEINIVWLALAAFIGGMATGLVGWAEAGTPWNARKFVVTLVRSALGGVAIAAATDYTGATSPIIYLLAVLAGAGVEVGSNRIAGAIKR